MVPQRRARPGIRRERPPGARRPLLAQGQAVKLRGRFTLALALAALVPIAVAAVVTRQVIATYYQTDYEDRRRAAALQVKDSVENLLTHVESVERTLASHNDSFVGALLLILEKQASSGLEYAVKVHCD